MLKKNLKTKIVQEHGIHDGDTGSAEVQIALFSKQIDELSKHLKKHKKDNSSRAGLLKMVGKRRRLLEHLKKEAPERHSKLVKKLDLA